MALWQGILLRLLIYSVSLCCLSLIFLSLFSSFVFRGPRRLVVVLELISHAGGHRFVCCPGGQPSGRSSSCVHQTHTCSYVHRTRCAALNLFAAARIAPYYLGRVEDAPGDSPSQQDSPTPQYCCTLFHLHRCLVPSVLNIPKSFGGTVRGPDTHPSIVGNFLVTSLFQFLEPGYGMPVLPPECLFDPCVLSSRSPTPPCHP